MTRRIPPKSDPHRRRSAAVRHLCRVDRRLADLIQQIGPYEPIITPDPFAALIGSIVQQQVSLAAAATIFGRLRRRCPRGRLTPGALLALDDAALRGVGLSRQKARYVRNIAEAFAGRRLTRAGLRRMSDDEVLVATTQIKGVGRWTAEMLLIFSLERPDVWPVDDLGLRRAVRRFLSAAAPPSADEMRALAEPWRPHRTCASWYLWQSLGGPLVPGIAV